VGEEDGAPGATSLCKALNKWFNCLHCGEFLGNRKSCFFNQIYVWK